MNKLQRKIVAISSVAIALIAIVAIDIGGFEASRYSGSYSITVFVKVFIISFIAPSLVVLFLCLGLYLFKADK
jgi:hypothetical protein